MSGLKEGDLYILAYKILAKAIEKRTPIDSILDNVTYNTITNFKSNASSDDLKNFEKTLQSLIDSDSKLAAYKGQIVHSFLKPILTVGAVDKRGKEMINMIGEKVELSEDEADALRSSDPKTTPKGQLKATLLLIHTTIDASKSAFKNSFIFYINAISRNGNKEPISYIINHIMAAYRKEIEHQTTAAASLSWTPAGQTPATAALASLFSSPAAAGFSRSLAAPAAATRGPPTLADGSFEKEFFNSVMVDPENVSLDIVNTAIEVSGFPQSDQVTYELSNLAKGGGGIQSLEGMITRELMTFTPAQKAKVNENANAIFDALVAGLPAAAAAAAGGADPIQPNPRKWHIIHSSGQNNDCLIHSFLTATCPAFQRLDENDKNSIANVFRRNVLYSLVRSLDFRPETKRDTQRRLVSRNFLENNDFELLCRLFKIRLAVFFSPRVEAGKLDLPVYIYGESGPMYGISNINGNHFESVSPYTLVTENNGFEIPSAAADSLERLTRPIYTSGCPYKDGNILPNGAVVIYRNIKTNGSGDCDFIYIGSPDEYAENVAYVAKEFDPDPSQRPQGRSIDRELAKVSSGAWIRLDVTPDGGLVPIPREDAIAEIVAKDAKLITAAAAATSATAGSAAAGSVKVSAANLKKMKNTLGPALTNWEQIHGTDPSKIINAMKSLGMWGGGKRRRTHKRRRTKRRHSRKRRA